MVIFVAKAISTDLLGIPLFVIGSYPTQATPAFSQLAQLGRFWSHRFFRSRQRLQALTFRKLLLCPTLPAPWPAELSARSFVGDVAPPEGSEVGDSLSGEDWRALLEGWRVGEAGPCKDIVPGFHRRQKAPRAPATRRDDGYRLKLGGRRILGKTGRIDGRAIGGSVVGCRLVTTNGGCSGCGSG